MGLVMLIVLFLVIPFVLGLIFFLRLLILNKNTGCGFIGLLVMIAITFVVCIILYIDYSSSHISKSDFIAHFEQNTGLDYPPSGKILEKNYQEFLNMTADLHCAAVIGMDSVDYNKLLHDVQSHGCFLLADYVRDSSSRLERRYASNNCAYFYISGKRSLWFHKNKRFVVYELVDY